ASLLGNLPKLTDSLLQRLLLLLERSAKLLFGSQCDFGFGESGVGGFATVAQMLQLRREIADLRLELLLGSFNFTELSRKAGSFLQTFLLLGRQGFTFILDGLDFLAEGALRIFERVEFTLAGGDRDFLGAQIGLRFLKAGLQ